MICAQSHYYIGIQIYATEPIVICHLWKWFYWRHQLLWVSILRELSARCCWWYNFYGSVFPAAGINMRAWTFEYGKVWIWVEHWSLEPVLFYGTITAFGLPSHLDPGQKREKMWWRTENCRKNGGKIFSITFLLLMWLVCNGGEA